MNQQDTINENYECNTLKVSENCEMYTFNYMTMWSFVQFYNNCVCSMRLFIWQNVGRFVDVLAYRLLGKKQTVHHYLSDVNAINPAQSNPNPRKSNIRPAGCSAQSS